MLADPQRIITVSRSGRYAVVHDNTELWIDDAQIGPLASPIPCRGDFACVGDELFVNDDSQLVRYSLRRPSISTTVELDVPIRRLSSDGEILVIETQTGWLAHVPTAALPTFEAIPTSAGDRVFAIGGRRLLRAGTRCAILGLDGTCVALDLAGTILYAGPGLGGWVALVDRAGKREVVLLAGHGRIVRRIGVPDAVTLRAGATSGRAVVVTREGRILVLDLRTADIAELMTATGEHLDAACDHDGRRIVVATRAPNSVIVYGPSHGR